MSLLTDEIETTAIMSGTVYNQFNRYDKLYPFTTENISAMYQEIEGKDILTIAGSGDQAFNAVNAGAKSVDVFDINRLALHYLRLKKCAIENLKLDDFKYFFSYRSKELYERIRVMLGDESREYWDYFFNHFIINPHQAFTETYLFYPQVSWNAYVKRNNYLNKESYLELQDKLPNHSFHFYNTELSNLHELLKKKYDRIYLSNINQYLSAYALKPIVDNLIQCLNEYGELYYAYIYSNKEDDISDIITPSKEIYVPSVVSKETQDKILIKIKTSN